MTKKKHIHFWLINSNDQGKCRDCPKTKDFRKLQHANHQWLHYLEQVRV